MEQGSTLFVIGESRTDKDNAITMQFGAFFMALEVERGTEEIRAFSCTHTLELTEEFLRRIFVGRRLLADSEQIEREVETRYLGSSRKAILVSYRDAIKRFRLATMQS